MRVGFRQLQLGDAVQFWNSTAPEPWHIDLAALTSCVVGCPCFDWGASAAWVVDGEMQALAWVKKSAARAYRGPDPDVSHLSAIVFRDAPAAADLLADIKHLLRQRGQAALIFGQDARHLFPGVPENWPGLADFLMVEGFVPAAPDRQCVDLTIDLASASPADDPRVRKCTSDDVPALLEFLDREFPGRWAFDVRDKLAHESDPGFISILDDGGIVGFAMTQEPSHRLHLAGATIVGSLPSPWLAIGPIGVAAEQRGRGLGTALMTAILAHAKANGVRAARVDWTHLIEWYEKLGFEVERRFTPMRLDLTELTDAN